MQMIPLNRKVNDAKPGPSRLFEGSAEGYEDLLRAHAGQSATTAQRHVQRIAPMVRRALLVRNAGAARWSTFSMSNEREVELLHGDLLAAGNVLGIIAIAFRMTIAERYFDLP